MKSDITDSLIAPAYFAGVQDGYRHLPPFELYTLVAAVGEHPAGSTVSRDTLEQAGFLVVPSSPNRRRNVKRAA